jgi:hypothetical protein
LRARPSSGNPIFRVVSTRLESGGTSVLSWFCRFYQ